MKIDNIDLAGYMQRAYLEYAMTVVEDRALPSIQDGQKPVQRRILYAMKDLGLGSRSDPTKSARVVGEVLGKYHPHGDSATYEAMVRMSQDFSLRYPLVDGIGNYGSRDGDSAAAYRYTETRLKPLAELLLAELAWKTVDMVPNFDEKEKEPTVLPARLPVLFLNGASGIAVGMATEFPSNNIRETVEAAKLLIKRPNASFDEMFDLMPGPDYPAGCTLISSREEIKNAYKTGRGSVRLRAKWAVEELDKGKWQLVFHEIPQGTSCEKVMAKINNLLDPKPTDKNNKKVPLTPEQNRLKKLFGELIKNYENGSDSEFDVRIVITPQDKKMDPQALAMALCAHNTDLEMNVPINMVAISSEGLAKSQGCFEWLQEWCNFRIETVRRRTQDQKRQVDERLHILAGRLSILDRIQEVVKMLTTSENPKDDLMSQYGLDEIQAEDILEIRLRSLARLEKTKLANEQSTKMKEQQHLAGILGDEKILRKLVIQELDADVKVFGDARKTTLEPQESSNAKNITLSVVAEKVAAEPVAVAITERGWLAWRPAKSLEEALTLDYKIKSGDEIRRVFFGDRNDNLLMMSESGQAYCLNLLKLPSKSDIVPLNNWFTLDKRIVEGVVASDGQQFLVCGTKGRGFIVKASDWANKMTAGKQFLKLSEGELPLPPLPVPAEGISDDSLLLALASDGRATAFKAKELPMLPKGTGNALMGFSGAHYLSDIMFVPSEGEFDLKNGKGRYKVKSELISSEYVGPRSSSKKGKALHKKSEGAIFVRPGREFETKE